MAARDPMASQAHILCGEWEKSKDKVETFEYVSAQGDTRSYSNPINYAEN